MDLNFKIDHQIMSRLDKNVLVNKSKNYVFCYFTFETTEWYDIEKFAIFKDSWGNAYECSLGTNFTARCVIPSDALRGTHVKISIYGGDRITTNELTVLLIPSGYTTNINPVQDPDNDKDVFVEIFEELDSKIDNIVYEDGYLRCYADGIVVAELMLFEDIREEIKELIPSFRVDDEGNLYVNYPD